MDYKELSCSWTQTVRPCPSTVIQTWTKCIFPRNGSQRVSDPVVGWRTGHQLYVSGWDMGQTKKSKQMLNTFFLKDGFCRLREFLNSHTAADVLCVSGFISLIYWLCFLIYGHALVQIWKKGNVLNVHNASTDNMCVLYILLFLF